MYYKYKRPSTLDAAAPGCGPQVASARHNQAEEERGRTPEQERRSKTAKSKRRRVKHPPPLFRQTTRALPGLPAFRNGGVGGAPPPKSPPRTPQSPKEWGGGKVKWCTIRWVATSRTSARLLRPFGVALQGHPQTALNSAGVRTFWGGPCRVPPQRASPEGTPFGFTPVPQKDEPCNQAETVRQKAQLRSATQESSTTRY